MTRVGLKLCTSPKSSTSVLYNGRKNPRDSIMKSKRENSDKIHRGQWKRPIEFILSLVGFSVGMGSIWRFPFLAMRNGGGAFLIPYIIFAIVIGIPVVFMETAFGQYFRLSPLLIFDVCPLFKGLGYSITILAFVGYLYGMVILAWVLYFLAMSFAPVLPWSTCHNPWNTNSCVPLFPDLSGNVTTTIANTANLSGHLATEEFWRFNVLEVSDGIDNPGSLRWQLVIAMFVAFVLVYVCIFKGIESSRIAVYLTATAPAVLLIVLLAWLLTREGSVDGLMYYLTPRWEKVANYQTWLEAFFQVFYSLGSGWGGLINLSSYNPFHHNCFRDSVIVAVTDTVTAIFCGAVVFAGVGCIAHQSGSHVAEVITTGPGLSFVTYPQVIASMPVPHLWAVLFFLLILFLGLDSQFANVKTITTGLTDLFPEVLSNRKPLLVLGFLALCFILSFPLVTQGGIYIFQIVDWYASFFTILLIAACESVVITWIYGADRFLSNIKEMGSFAPEWFLRFMKFSWMVLVPLSMMTALTFAMATFRSPKYGDYVYPDWTNVFGWILAISSSLPIPGFMIYALAKERGTLRQRLKSSIKPAIGKGGVRIPVRDGPEVEMMMKSPSI